MKPYFDLLTWFLEKEIRARNAISVLAALAVMVAFYFFLIDPDRFPDLNKRAFGLPAALSVVFVAAFLISSLVGKAISPLLERRETHRRQNEQAERREEHVRRTLFSLTEWQRKFLLRYIVEERTQIPEWEVGQYRLAWDHEMQMLVQKRVVRYYRKAGVYEIEEQYHEYLLCHWDPEKGTLN